MRILLFTGKGGVGKTSLAAATALATAKRGRSTLIMSTDPAHSLGDAMQTKLTGEPREVCPNLWALEIDAARRFEEVYSSIQQYLVKLFAHFDMDEVIAEEISVFPGIDELLSLIEVYEESRRKRFRTLILDTAPTGTTLRLLSFPEVAGWYGRKILPLERRVARVVKPVVNRVSRLPLIPDDDLYQGIKSMVEKVEQLHGLLSDAKVSSVRLVLQPEKMVIKETQRAYTQLCLFGFPVDAAIVNRVLPADAGPYFSEWGRIQRTYLAEIEAAFSPLPILRVPFYPQEMIGIAALERLGDELYAGLEPEAVLYKERPFTFRKRGKNRGTIQVKLPFNDGRLDIFQSGGEVVVVCGSLKRHIALPESMIGFDLDGYEQEGEQVAIQLRRKEAWEY